jgi:hypothetical protein
MLPLEIIADLDTNNYQLGTALLQNKAKRYAKLQPGSTPHDRPSAHY